MKWNPWHGCKKLSEGCRNCYVYRIDSRHEKNAAEIRKNVTSFDLPITKNKNGEYKYPSGTLFYTCFTSDFFLEEADIWRDDAWSMMRERSDCRFFFITKRIDRFKKSIPSDWKDGYDNVTIGVTVENNAMASYRLPLFKKLPIKKKIIICEPLLECIDLSKYLSKDFSLVSVGGESGNGVRDCHYEWILKMREMCVEADVPFEFRQTGTHFIKDRKLYLIPKAKQSEQAAKAGIDYRREDVII